MYTALYSRRHREVNKNCVSIIELACVFDSCTRTQFFLSDVGSLSPSIVCVLCKRVPRVPNLMYTGKHLLGEISMIRNFHVPFFINLKQCWLVINRYIKCNFIQL